MTPEINALLQKEWIKLRPALLCVLALMIYASIDFWLILHEIYRSGGYFGLSMTVMDSKPLLFSGFNILSLAAVIIAFAQVFPESQSKRLRILFHMPISPERIIGISLLTGLLILLVLFTLSVGIQVALYQFYHLPAEQIQTLIISFSTWFWRAVGLYCATTVFFATKILVIRGFALITGFFIFDVTQIWGYELNLPSTGSYFALCLLMFGLAFFSYLDFKHRAKQNINYRVVRFSGLFMVAISLSYFLPALYWSIFTPATTQQIAYYSQNNNEFLVFNALPERKTGAGGARTLEYFNQSGERISEEEYKQSLPFLYTKDLLKWKLWPQQINGQVISPKQARSGWSKTRFSPSKWNAPETQLFRLIESQPKGSRYKLPQDIMRLSAEGSALEFYRPHTADFDLNKGKLFTQALMNAGVSMPILRLDNNSQIRRKQFDNGVILADANNRLFQMKMIKGNPWVKNLNLVIDGELRGLKINEDRLKRIMAFVTTKDQFYVITQEAEPRLLAVDVADYHIDYTSFSFMPDLLGTTIVGRDNRKSYTERDIIARRLDAELSNLEQFTLPLKAEDKQALDSVLKASAVLFPIRVLLADNQSAFMKLRLASRWQHHLIYALLGSLLALLIMFFRWRQKQTSLRTEDVALVALFGLFGLLTVELITHRH